MKKFIIGATCMASLIHESHSFLDFFEPKAFNVQRITQGLLGGFRDGGYQQKQNYQTRDSDSRNWSQNRNDESQISNNKLGENILMDFDRNFVNNLFSQSINLKPGNYRLNLDCGTRQGYRIGGSGIGNGMSVYWNKKLIKKFNIQDYEPHKYIVQLQSIGGSNTLQIKRQGQIQAYRIVLLDGLNSLTSGPSVKTDEPLNVFNTKYVRSSVNLLKNGNFGLSSPSQYTNPSFSYRYHKQLPYWQVSQIERGYGWVYNRRWGNLPVIELDGNKNDYLRQRIRLKKAIYQFNVDYACRQGFIQTSGLSIYWNNKMVKKITGEDEQIHKLQILLTAEEGENVLEIRGQGESDSYGMTITNVRLYETDIPLPMVLANPTLALEGLTTNSNSNNNINNISRPLLPDVQIGKVIKDNINTSISTSASANNGVISGTGNTIYSSNNNDFKYLLNDISSTVIGKTVGLTQGRNGKIYPIEMPVIIQKIPVVMERVPIVSTPATVTVKTPVSTITNTTKIIKIGTQNNNNNSNSTNTNNTNNTSTSTIAVTQQSDNSNTISGTSNSNNNKVSSQIVGANTVVGSSVQMQQIIVDNNNTNNNNNSGTTSTSSSSSSSTSSSTSSSSSSSSSTISSSSGQQNMRGFTQTPALSYNKKLGDRIVLVCDPKLACLIRQRTVLQHGSYRFSIQYTIKQGTAAQKHAKIGIYINNIKVNTLQPKTQQVQLTDLTMKVESSGQFVFQVRGEDGTDAQGFAVTDLKLVPVPNLDASGQPQSQTQTQTQITKP